MPTGIKGLPGSTIVELPRKLQSPGRPIVARPARVQEAFQHSLQGEARDREPWIAADRQVVPAWIVVHRQVPRDLQTVAVRRGRGWPRV